MGFYLESSDLGVRCLFVARPIFSSKKELDLQTPPTARAPLTRRAMGGMPHEWLPLGSFA